MAWSFIEVNTQRDGKKLLIHTSFRKNGKVSSASCGEIKNIDSLKETKGAEYEKYIKDEGEIIYQKWLESSYTSHDFTLYETKEQENYKEIFSSQIYLRKIWNDLEINKELDSIKINNKRKYKFDLNEITFFLATKQLFDSSSKLKAYTDRDQYLFSPSNLTLDSLYDSLDVLAEHADEINLCTYKKAKKYLDKSSKLYFYDVTSVNMSKSVEENSLVGMKKGKEGIFGPIIQIGYLCDEWGLLIGLIVFKGNKSEQSTLQEQITKIYGISKIKDVVICTDAGLCSIKNKQYCETNFNGYITTQPLTRKKVPDYIRKWAIEKPFDYNDNGITKQEIIDNYFKAVDKDPALAKQMLQKTYYKSRWYITTTKIDSKGKEALSSLKEIKEEERGKVKLSKADISSLDKIKKGKPRKVTFEQRLVVSFNLKYYLKQIKDLEEEKEKAVSVIQNKTDISSASKKDFKRFLKTTRTTENGEVAEETATEFLNDEYEYEKSLCGIYCQATNLVNKSNEIYKSARNRWIIEYSFRTAKTSLGMGTVYLQKESHIIGHFELCFLAQMMLRILTYKLYKKINHSEDKLGKIEDENYEVTQDKILEELIKMKSSIEYDNKKEKCLVARCNKSEINKYLAEAFKLSLTTQVKKYDEINKYLK